MSLVVLGDGVDLAAGQPSRSRMRGSGDACVLCGSS